MKYILFLFAVSLISCTNSKENTKPKIVCTTGMIGDLTENIVGNNIEVITLMSAGVDPHLYKPTAKDIQALKEATIIIYNGLHLEGKMQQILHQMEGSKAILAVGETLPKEILIKNSEFDGNFDPHIWFDVNNWMIIAKQTTAFLSKVHPELKENFEENSQKYVESLEQLHQNILSQISEIPENRRHLVTAHDAFGYYGKAYGIKVRGLQGVSTVAEFGIKDVTSLASFLKDKEIKAIFVESSISDRSLKKVIETCENEGHKVSIGGELYSDAMGPKDSEAGNYIGMLKHNTKTIVQALK